MSPYSPSARSASERYRHIQLLYSTRRFLTKIPFIIVSCGFMGCFSTNLPPIDPPPELIRLEQLARTPLILTVEISEELSSSTVGFQYTLGFLPVTRVYTPYLPITVANMVRLEAGLRGVACIPNQDEPNRSRQQAKRRASNLTIVVDDLSVNGYDLIVIRKPSASITLTGYLSSGSAEAPEQPTRQCSAAAEESFSSNYAFEDELNEALRRAIIRAAGMILDCLGKPRA
jgi:hypothetical protein